MIATWGVLAQAQPFEGPGWDWLGDPSTELHEPTVCERRTCTRRTRREELRRREAWLAGLASTRTAFEACLAATPSDPDCRHGQIFVAFVERDYDSVITASLGLMAELPWEDERRRHLEALTLGSLDNLGRYAEAAAFVEDLDRAVGGTRPLHLLFCFDLRLGLLDDARAHLEALRADDPAWVSRSCLEEELAAAIAPPPPDVRPRCFPERVCGVEW